MQTLMDSFMVLRVFPPQSPSVARPLILSLPISLSLSFWPHFVTSWAIIDRVCLLLCWVQYHFAVRFACRTTRHLRAAYYTYLLKIISEWHELIQSKSERERMEREMERGMERGRKPQLLMASSLFSVQTEGIWNKTHNMHKHVSMSVSVCDGLMCSHMVEPNNPSTENIFGSSEDDNSEEPPKLCSLGKQNTWIKWLSSEANIN